MFFIQKLTYSHNISCPNFTFDSLILPPQQKNPALRRLNLRHNQLEDGAAQWLRDALGENFTLEHLDVSWNHFQSRGCVLLAEGLGVSGR